MEGIGNPNLGTTLGPSPRNGGTNQVDLDQHKVGQEAEHARTCFGLGGLVMTVSTSILNLQVFWDTGIFNFFNSGNEFEYSTDLSKMQQTSGRSKGKVRWTKLYSFSCLRPTVSLQDSSTQQFGGPGFSRVVFCNQSHFHKKSPFKYPSNYISMTKYNVITFLPKALFEQFRRVANLYFLLAAALSTTSVGPFLPMSVIAPLVFVVGLSMAKEAMEDWHRFVQDLKVNSRTVKVHVGNGDFKDKPWKGLHVGDVVKVMKNEYFPSDLLLLSSSYDDGLCYVETMNLDGETNLKLKRCLEVTLGLDHDVEFSSFNAKICCEDPNPNLYSFVGNVEFEDQVYALSPAQILLRDSKLRNTEYVFGVVIFSGPDTKVVQNSTRSPSKRSCIERKMDFVIYVLFSMLVLISLVSAIGSSLYTKFEMVDWWYLCLTDNEHQDPFFNPNKAEWSGILQFIRSLILYGYLIPISLYVSIEVVKVSQALLINWDVKMYDDETSSSAKARTSNLNEELGQVEMILTDKTGTLTCNQMEFRKCSVAGISYGGEVNEVDLAASKRMNADLENYNFSINGSDSMSQSLDVFKFSVTDFSTQKAVFFKEDVGNSNIGNANNGRLGRESIIKGFNFRDDRLLNKDWIRTSQVSDVAMFFRILALCHTGIPVEDGKTGQLKYEAESPEEVSFLIAAQEFGFKFCRRTQSVMVLKELNPSSGVEVEREYKLLNLLEFSSSRKRMSVIVRDEAGQIFLLCKGADSIIFDRLGVNGKQYQQATSSHLSDYAEDGLRTLALAYRRIEPAEYENWNLIFTRSKTTIGPEREKLLERASEMIERDLILLGAAAVEDKLQKGVPECIDKLAQAGLKIWLLTGDKKETAINIGFACSLLRHDMQQFNLSLNEAKEGKSNEKALKEDILLQIETAYQVTCNEGNSNKPFALVVDGKALELALQTDVKCQFLRLAVNCASVICCRVSPKQKALVTTLVKDYTRKTTLAIGDGANDVGMIQAADIGVGISGMEGMQAVMASDFSLPQFRFLERLLIVHGHWCYKRISKMVLYFVYKNVTFGLTLFYYELYSSFSGEIPYNDWYMALFNVILTSLPVISLGVLEQDVSSDVCLQFPALYQQGQKNIYFSWIRIIGWIMNGVFASLAIFILTIHLVSPSAFQSTGEVMDIAHLGATMYTIVIWTVNCQIALIINHFTWIQHLFIWGSISFWYIFLFIYGALPLEYSHQAFRLLSEALGPAPTYWLATLVVVTVAILPYFVFIVFQRTLNPMDDHVIQEIKYCGTDVTDSSMWLREQKNSKKNTHIGITSRVDAKIRHWKEQLQNKKQAISKSLTNSPFF
ncbi:probable phospholipid-transporting ATPase 5 [Magnolia sinica]|uniref:probable phospholipid-transporting ATPase 5 n=1 Tax=Magnolia sinica TaxID=86752 RepID=UPI00265A8C15|nr:probable phospholipid-transporting ATPase 5 [Magnolia sinica]